MLFHKNYYREAAAVLKSHVGRTMVLVANPRHCNGHAGAWFHPGEDDFDGMRVVALNQQQALHAGISLAPDDDVVVHGNTQPLAGFDDFLRHLDVGA